MAQSLDQTFWRTDMTSARRAVLNAEIAEHDLAFSTTEDDLDLSKIPPGLMLVGDHGVYIISNASYDEVIASGVPHVAYAAEVNPETMEFDAWWEAKKASFGSDDGADFLAESEILSGLNSDKPYVIILTPDDMSLPVELENYLTPRP